MSFGASSKQEIMFSGQGFRREKQLGGPTAYTWDQENGSSCPSYRPTNSSHPLALLHHTLSHIPLPSLSPTPLSGGPGVLITPGKILKFYIAVGEFWRILEARNMVSGQGFRRKKLLVSPTCPYCYIWKLANIYIAAADIIIFIIVQFFKLLGYNLQVEIYIGLCLP